MYCHTAIISQYVIYSIFRNANSEFSPSLASFSWHSSNLSKKIAPHANHEKSLVKRNAFWQVLTFLGLFLGLKVIFTGMTMIFCKQIGSKRLFLALEMVKTFWTAIKDFYYRRFPPPAVFRKKCQSEK